MSKNVDSVDMQLFVHIAAEQNLTRGAERSHLSLPAASMRVKMLEEGFGVRLLNRSSRGVTLTLAGETLLHHAERVLQQCETLHAAMCGFTRQIKGEVRMAANSTSMSKSLPSVLANYLMAYPDVSVHLIEQSSEEGVRALTEGAVDIAVVADNDVHVNGLHVLPYDDERLVLVTSTEHMLAEQPQVSFADTLDFGYVLLQDGTSLQRFLSRQAQCLNRKLVARAHVGSLDAVCRMIEANTAIAVLPESTARSYAKLMSIRVTQLSDAWSIRHLVVCVRDLSCLPTYTRDLLGMLGSHAARVLPQ